MQLLMILVNVSIRFPDNCLSYSLKLVVDQVKGKCTQFPLCQPAFSSSKDSQASLSIPAATKPQPDGAGTAAEGRRLYKHHFPFPIWETTQISGSVLPPHLPEQALVAAAQGSLHFMLPANSHCVVTCRN